jgi:hypothetical protein
MRILSAYAFTPLPRENSIRAQGPRICLKLSASFYYTTKPTYIFYLNFIRTVLHLHVDGDDFSVPSSKQVLRK